jgi:subtilisin family serine protease
MSRGALVHLLIAAGLACACAPANAAAPAAGGKLDPDVQPALAALAPGETLQVIVKLRSQEDVSAIGGATRATRLERLVRALRARAESTQGPLRSLIAGERAQRRVRDVTFLWIFNGFALDATPAVIRLVAAHPLVERVSVDAALAAPASGGAAPWEVNLGVAGVPPLWPLGLRGQGVVVASLDTGVDHLHPDLAAQWRGGANSWYDPAGQHPGEPFDANGHGTATMGVMVGRGEGGTSIGVAPDARWIAAKIFDDSGFTTLSRIHQAYQWVIDPDRNPATADAPNVVNNSWAFERPGCDTEFQGDLSVLRAAGILPVFAAGNAGPGGLTSRSPANNLGAFAVGSIDNGGAVAPGSSRGPSACADDDAPFPELVAPGVNVRSTDLFDLYAPFSGTSIAAAHVAGALALLLSVRPNATVLDQAAALLEGAVDLGVPGADNEYGAGRLDAVRARDRISAIVPPAPPAPPAPPTLFFSRGATGPATIGDVTGVAGEDVLSFNGSDFDMVFDGSDVGLAGVNVEGFARLDADSFLLSFGADVTLPGVGPVERFDVVRFDAGSLGPATAGVFSWYVDGSDVGLSASTEQIDAIDVLSDGRVLVSTVGAVSVTGVSGAGEDLLVLTPTSVGATTAGSWKLYFDGSDVGLTASTEKVDAAAVAPSGDLELSTNGAVSVPGAGGTADDVLGCAPTSIGPTTACNWWASPVFDGAPWGLGAANVDAVEVP